MTLTSGNISQRILKAMGLFGGLQIVTIACFLLRTKFIALWIGPVGVGFFSLFNSAIDTVYAGTSLSLRNASVPRIASASGSQKDIIIAAVRKWALITGLIGLAVMLLLSPWLSEWTFKSTNYTLSFCALAIVLLLLSWGDGEKAILQGTGKLSSLARSSIMGLIGAVVLSLPMFYFWGVNSIVPAIIIFALASSLPARLETWRHIPRLKVKQSLREILASGNVFIRLGFYMMLSGFVTYLCNYIFAAYINNEASTAMVGFYQAGYTLVDKYAGLLFTAMAMEYYPRLATVCLSRNRTSLFVTRQSNLTLALLIPIIPIFILLREPILLLIYSSEFLEVAPFLAVAVGGTIFRTVSWSLGFVLLARSDGKLYLITELLSCAINLSLNILMWNLWGLTGIAIAYVAGFAAYFVIMEICCRMKYGITTHRSTSLLSLIAIIFAGASLAAAFLLPLWVQIAIAAGGCIVAIPILKHQRILTPKKN